MGSLAKIRTFAVIGAGGKMGKGIALVLLSQFLKLKKEDFFLHLIDQNEESLIPLKKYLESHLKKEGEKDLLHLRALYLESDRVDNSDFIQGCLDYLFERVFFSTSLDETKDCDLIFEAIFEKRDLKIAALQKTASLSPKGLILSNTSSIPIHYLEEKSGLKGRIAGFHFYNPPFVQRLVEVIVPKGSTEEFLEICMTVAKDLEKIPIVSKDTAGFIGNGIFMREILFSLKLLEILVQKKGIPLTEAIATLDLITKLFLFRPMGIFQLIDYVGIDVAVNVLDIMNFFLDDSGIDSPLLKNMLSLGKKGGYRESAEDGFFRYKEGLPYAVFDPDKKEYVPMEGVFLENVLRHIGSPIDKVPSWKSLSKEKESEKIMEDFYNNFFREDSLGAHLTLKYLLFEKDISFLLVKTEVAKNLQDISSVLKLGFYHLFGPTSPFISSLEPTFCRRFWP